MTYETFTRIIASLTPEQAASLWPVAAAGVASIIAVTAFIRYKRNPAFRARLLAARGATPHRIAQRLRMSQDVAALAAHRARNAAPAVKLLPARASASSYPAPPSSRRAPRMSLTA